MLASIIGIIFVMLILIILFVALAITQSENERLRNRINIQDELIEQLYELIEDYKKLYFELLNDK